MGAIPGRLPFTRSFMKKLAVLLVVLGLSMGLVLGWDTVRRVGADLLNLDHDDPDMPQHLKAGVSKEEFMRMRAEGTAMKRGLHEGEDVDPQARPKAVEQLAEQETARFELPASREKTAMLAAWTPIGPAPIPNAQVGTGPSTTASGRVLSIAVHPTNPDIVYVGTAQGGLYRSTNGGTTWTALMDGALSLAVGALALAPSNPEILYVGTGESGFCADCFFGVGVYRIDNPSTTATVSGPFNKDAGNVDVFTGRGIGEVTVHPTDPNTIFVGSTSGLGGIGGQSNNVLPSRGLYRSTNAAGANPTFARITGLAGNGNLSVRDVAIDPSNPNILIANVIANGGGIYRTANALAADATTVTFTQPEVFSSTSTSELTAEFAAIHPAGDTDATFYAAVGNLGGRVLRSTNGGVSFTQMIDNNFCTPQCFYDIAVAVDPTNASRLYLGGSPTLAFGRSSDSGATFTTNAASAQGLHVDSHAIAVAPSNPSIVYFGSDGGIYRTNDASAATIAWTSLNNTTFSATQFMSIAVHPTDPNFTIGGTQDNGTNMFNAAGTWFRVDGGDGGFTLIDQNAVDTTSVRQYHKYFSSGGSQIGYATRTSTAQASGGWTLRGCFSSTPANGVTCDATTLFYAPMEQGPGNPNTVYFGSDRLYRSADLGVSHTQVSQAFGVEITAIGISPQNDNIRIIGHSRTAGQISGTTTGSSTLTDFDPLNQVPSGYVARAAIDPKNPDRAYVTLANFGINTVYRTNNLSAPQPTWTSISNGLPQVPASAFVIDPINPQNLYVGTDIGVYATSDGGSNWTPLGTGLPRVAVFDMAITNVAPRKLRIATHGRGMFEHPLSTPVSRADFDGDGRTDLSIFRPADGTWWMNRSVAGIKAQNWGLNGDVPVPGDYDADGKTDVAVWRPTDPNGSTFYVFNSATNTVSYGRWGNATDIPIVGDFNGDGRTDMTVWRPSDRNWYTLNSGGGFTVSFFGLSTDIPLAFDLEGDGRTNLAVYRPSEGRWYVANHTGVPAQNFVSVGFGIATDLPVAGDFDGDNKDDFAVFRASEGNWYILQSASQTTLVRNWGLAGDVPVPGDYDGDGRDDIAVYRAGTWYLSQSTSGLGIRNFGLATDTPIPKKYIP